MKRIIATLGLASTLLLGGCDSAPRENAYKLSSEDSQEWVILGIGERINTKYVKHIEGNEYELGIIQADNSVKWYNTSKNLSTDGQHGRDAKLDTVYEDIEESFLERKPNIQAERQFTQGYVYHFLLHISNKVPLQGGVTERNCGKNCTREVPTQIISQ